MMNINAILFTLSVAVMFALANAAEGDQVGTITHYLATSSATSNVDEANACGAYNCSGVTDASATKIVQVFKEGASATAWTVTTTTDGCADGNRTSVTADAAAVTNFSCTDTSVNYTLGDDALQVQNGNETETANCFQRDPATAGSPLADTIQIVCGDGSTPAPSPTPTPTPSPTPSKTSGASSVTGKVATYVSVSFICGLFFHFF